LGRIEFGGGGLIDNTQAAVNEGNLEIGQGRDDLWNGPAHHRFP